MDKLTQALKSRTVWTVVLMVVVNAVNANLSLMPNDVAIPLNMALGALATYFKVKPSQDYNPKA